MIIDTETKNRNSIHSVVIKLKTKDMELIYQSRPLFILSYKSTYTQRVCIPKMGVGFEPIFTYSHFEQLVQFHSVLCLQLGISIFSFKFGRFSKAVHSSK